MRLVRSLSLVCSIWHLLLSCGGFWDELLHSDPVVFKGIAQSFDGGNSIPIRLYLPRGEITKLKVEQVSLRDFALLDNLGKETSNKIKNFSVVEAINGKYEIYSGIYLGDQGQEAEFVISTDSVGGDDLIIIALLIALICVSAMAYDQERCEEQLKDEIQTCIAGGGLPTVSTEISFSIKGCNVKCSLSCNPRDLSA